MGSLHLSSNEPSRRRHLKLKVSALRLQPRKIYRWDALPWGFRMGFLSLAICNYLPLSAEPHDRYCFDFESVDVRFKSSFEAV